MSTKPPPVPPANRSDKGTGSTSPQHESDVAEAERRAVPENLAKQGQQGNTKVNTTHQGHTQDR
jgi:hypothetical protein